MIKTPGGRYTRIIYWALAQAIGLSSGAHAANGPQPTFTWIKANILHPACYACHGDDIEDLSYLKGSDGYVVAGVPDDSLMYRQVKMDKMPPKPASPLTGEEVQAIYDWIAQGALDN